MATPIPLGVTWAILRLAVVQYAVDGVSKQLLLARFEVISLHCPCLP